MEHLSVRDWDNQRCQRYRRRWSRSIWALVISFTLGCSTTPPKHVTTTQPLHYDSFDLNLHLNALLFSGTDGSNRRRLDIQWHPNAKLETRMLNALNAGGWFDPLTSDKGPLLMIWLSHLAYDHNANPGQWGYGVVATTPSTSSTTKPTELNCMYDSGLRYDPVTLAFQDNKERLPGLAEPSPSADWIELTPATWPAYWKQMDARFRIAEYFEGGSTATMPATTSTKSH